MKRALIAAAALSLTIMPVTTAHAAFPGNNGKIVYRDPGNLFVMQPNWLWRDTHHGDPWW